MVRGRRDYTALRPLCFRLCALTVLLVLHRMVAVAQVVHAGPLQTEADILRSLYHTNSRLALDIGAFALADTNVMPLTAAGRPFRLPSTFVGEVGYYRLTAGRSLSIRQGSWTVGWTNAVSDLYQGNRDAVRVYLAAERGDSVYPSNASISVHLDRSDIHHWQVEYRAPVGRVSGVTVGARFHWLKVARLQRGSLAGESSGGAFAGDLLLQTTRGLPSHKVAGRGYALDVSATAAFGPNCAVTAVVQNLLSGVWVSELQRVESAVRVNQVVPDADGILHTSPLLFGQITREGFGGHLARHVALAFRRGHLGEDQVALLRNDGGWQAGVGLVRRSANGNRSCLVLWPSSMLWQVGLAYGQAEFHLGWSSLAPRDAKQAVASVRWSLTARQ